MPPHTVWKVKLSVYYCWLQLVKPADYTQWVQDLRQIMNRNRIQYKYIRLPDVIHARIVRPTWISMYDLCLVQPGSVITISYNLLME